MDTKTEAFGLSPTQTRLLEYLHSVCSLFPNQSYEGVVLKRGRPFTKRLPIPRTERFTKIGECFLNASRQMNEKAGRIYCEGFAVSENLALPLLHAWIVEDDSVYDSTWQDKTEIAYYGMCFSTRLVHAAMTTYGFFGWTLQYLLKNEKDIDLVDGVFRLKIELKP